MSTNELLPYETDIAMEQLYAINPMCRNCAGYKDEHLEGRCLFAPCVFEMLPFAEYEAQRKASLTSRILRWCPSIQ